MHKEKKLIDEYLKGRESLNKLDGKLEEYFGPLIDEALESQDFNKVDEIMKRIPESVCRFKQWRKYQLYLDKIGYGL